MLAVSFSLLLLATGASACADVVGYTGPYGGTCSSWVVGGVSDCSPTSTGYVVSCGPPAVNSAGQTFNRGSQTFPAADAYGQACEAGSLYYSGYWTAAQTTAIQTNCPVSCNTCPTAAPVTATRDPHFKLPHGGRTDIRGENGAIYNLLSAKNLSFAAQFEDADFQWSKRLVHGSKMSHAYWTVRTHTDKVVNVEYAAQSVKGGHALVVVKGTKIHVTEGKPFLLANVNVTLVGRKLFVETGKWRMIATANSFPFAELNKNKVLLDIEVTPLYDADKDVVAPHGIFGQAYDDDDFAVNGMVDHAQANEMTTKAQGEGAIEGVIADYKIAGPHETAFKYSRFDAVSAPHRDVSKLTGAKVPRVNVPRGMVHAAADHKEVEA